jgi:CHRD domain
MKKAYLETLGVAAALLTIAAIAAMLVAPSWAGPVTADNDDDGGGPEFRAELSGDQEVPPVTTQSEGEAKIQFNEDLTAAEFDLEVDDGVRVTQAHIHCAPAGSNGDIVVFLAGFHAPGWDVDGDWIGDASFTVANIVDPECGTTLAQLAEAMAQGRAYVNVHTQANPGGEIRGQLEGDGDNGNGDRDEENDD